MGIKEKFLDKLNGPRVKLTIQEKAVIKLLMSVDTRCAVRLDAEEAAEVIALLEVTLDGVQDMEDGVVYKDGRGNHRTDHD
jgi:hypothetical protein